MKPFSERYHRQIILGGFGTTAQQALLRARVLVIGAGGLGCPVLQYLVAAGTGFVGIADDDVVTLSNLHRQVLYTNSDIGKPKATVAAERLRRMNPDAELLEYPIRVKNNNCLDLLDGYDIIIDCTDNFASRYLINDACVLKGKPLVYGAVNRLEGQVAVFNAKRPGGMKTGNYRDLFPIQPGETEVMNCAEAGVLGVLPGIIGSMQALEAIKLITGIGDPLVNSLLTYDAACNQVAVFKYDRNPRSSELIPADETGLRNRDYGSECLTGTASVEIDWKNVEEMARQELVQVVDVREPDEVTGGEGIEMLNIPLNQLASNWERLTGSTVVFICRSGSRSLRAATMAADYFRQGNRFFSLRGGIVAMNISSNHLPA